MKLLVLLNRLERVFLVSLFLVMVALFTANVAIREFGGTYASNFAWIEEAVRLMNLFLVFGAIGLAMERGRHVSVTTLRDKIKQPWCKLLLKTIDAVGLVFCLYLVWLGVRMVDFVLGTGQRSPTLDIPMGYIYLAPSIGFGLLALRYGLSLLGVIDRFGTNKTAHGGEPLSGDVL
jgi:TRAP-type transport system small permease protein